MAVRFVVRSREGQKLQTELAFPFDQARIVLGRGAAADVRIPDPAVSDAHASVQLRGNDWMVADLGSRNGTKHNGQRLLAERPRKLRDGDLIELGTYTLSFHTGVLMTEPMSAERTAELARRLWREAQSARGIELPSARLCILSGPRTGDRLEIPTAPSRTHIGSHDKCQMVLPEPALVRDTLEIAHDLEGVLIRSLSGDAIIEIGAQRFKSRRLRDGDEIVIGTTRCLFEEPAQGAIDALKGEPVLLSAAPLPEQTATVPGPAGRSPERPSERPSVRPPTPIGRTDADLVIYALAIAVLVASALGLALLLRVR